MIYIYLALFIECRAIMNEKKMKAVNDFLGQIPLS